MSEPRPLGRLARAQRWFEFLLLYVVLPGVLAGAIDRQGRVHGVLHAIGLGRLIDIASERPGALIFPILLGSTVLIVAVLLLDRSFDRTMLWGWRRARPDLGRLLRLWAINAVLLVGVSWFLCFQTDVLPEKAFFRLPREAPGLLVAIWLLYPIWSAFPQEITHRVFFFHRYGVLFPGRGVLIVVNALAFSWMHALFWNVPALVMTFFGGLLFAWTFDRTRSGLAAGVEHGLYGNWIFTTGLGWFVFAGSIGSAHPG